MPKVRPELLELDSLVTNEVTQLNHKFSFWNIKPAIDTNWSGSTSSSNKNDYSRMMDILESIKNIGELPPEQQSIVGIGWEFIWGVTPPEEITQLRGEVQNKAKYRDNLSKQELLWLQLMAIDTDSFLGPYHRTLYFDPLNRLSQETFFNPTHYYHFALDHFSYFHSLPDLVEHSSCNICGR